MSRAKAMKLRAKAASTEFPAEKEALLAKARQLEKVLPPTVIYGKGTPPTWAELQDNAVVWGEA